MSIRNVESTLPDPRYIRALETELAELRKLMEQLQLDQVSARQ